MPAIAVTLRQPGDSTRFAISAETGRALLGSDPDCDIVVPASPPMWFSVEALASGGAELRFWNDGSFLDGVSAGLSETVKPSLLGVLAGKGPSFRVARDGLEASVSILSQLTIGERASRALAASWSPRVRGFSHRSLAHLAAAVCVAAVLGVLLLPGGGKSIGLPQNPAGVSGVSGPLPTSTDHQIAALGRIDPVRSQGDRRGEQAQADARSIRESLVRVGVQSPIGVEVRGNEVIMSGQVNGRDTEAVKTIVSNVQSAGVRVIDRTQIQDSAPDIRFRSTSAAPPFVVLESGKRVMIGEVVRDNWVLTGITARSVSISRGDLARTLPRQ